MKVKDSFDLMSLIISELPKYTYSHPRSSDLYKFLFKITQDYMSEKFISKELRPTKFGPFGNITFPYHEMGNITSLNLFELDELMLFSYYYLNKNCYKNVLDLGANIGLHSLLLSRLGFSVRSYEPDPIHFKILKETVSNNKLDNIELYNSAISTQSGEHDFVRVLGNTMSSHLSGDKDNAYGSLETISVSTININDIIPWADFIKMDIEGQEGQVVPFIKMEYWANTDMMLEVGNEENAIIIFKHFAEKDINLFSQKNSWKKVSVFDEMPTSYKDGSLFISCKDKMLWPL